MEWVADIIPQGRRNRPYVPIVPKYITMHDTGNSSVGAGAKMHGKFLREHADPVTPPNVRSWHATVDDQFIVQHLLFNEMSYHSGNVLGNETSIGIEICQNSDCDRAKAEDAAAHLVADLMGQFGISIENIVPHGKWVGTNCPAILKLRWHGFIIQVAEYAGLVDVGNGRWKQFANELYTTWQKELATMREMLDLIENKYWGDKNVG